MIVPSGKNSINPSPGSVNLSVKMSKVSAREQLNVKTIGVNAYETLVNLKSPANIEGVFENSFYVKVGEYELIRVTRHEQYVSASSIIVDEKDRDSGFKSMGIEQGMRVLCGKKDILIGKRFAVANIHGVAKWQPPRVPDSASIRPLEIIKLNLRVLRDVIYTCPSREGLVPLLENVELVGSLDLFLKPRTDSFAERARPGIERVMWGIFSLDKEAVIESAKTIIGLGPGLTPSCDDFLYGLVVSLKNGAEVLGTSDGTGFFDEIAGAIYEEARQKTTIFGASMLREAREGVCPLAVVNLIHCLLTEDVAETVEVSKTLIRMGETSGADIAIGVFYGIRFLVSRLENLEVLHETA